MTEEEWLSTPPGMAFAGLDDVGASPRGPGSAEDVEDLSEPAHHIAMMMLGEEGQAPVSEWADPNEQARAAIRAEGGLSAFPPLSDGT